MLKISSSFNIILQINKKGGEILIVKEFSPFHSVPIEKGIYGELSKIKEELAEALDAEAQGIDLMLLIELADIIGAVEGVSKKFGFNLEQLLAFARKRSEVAQYELHNQQRRNS